METNNTNIVSNDYKLMSDEQKIKNRIIETSREMFFRSGFSKVTMDEIAAELGMSKKTVYKFFPTKMNLLDEIAQFTRDEFQVNFDAVLENKELDVLQKLNQFIQIISSRLSSLLNKSFLNDLQKFAPEVWQKMEAFRKEMIYTRFGSLIQEGIREGVFRNDIPQDVIVLIFFSAINNVINPTTLAHLPLTAEEAYQTINKIFLEGLMTEKSRANY